MSVASPSSTIPSKCRKWGGWGPSRRSVGNRPASERGQREQRRRNHACHREPGTEPGRGVIVLPSVATITSRGRIIALMARYRLPAVYEFPIFARDGGLISYGIDSVAQYRQAASYVEG